MTDTRIEAQRADPPYLVPGYRSTIARAPSRPLVIPPYGPSELTSPVFGESDLGVHDHDLTQHHEGEPQGQRITVHGYVRDAAGKPVRNSLVEVWQTNAAGRYAHRTDQHPAPLDPNFTGAGRTLTDNDGYYRFVTIHPGAYPWRNHENAWRPAHIHFSVFGWAFPQRLVTQMYFQGDPLFFQDPVFNSIPDERARQRLIAAYDHEESVPEWSLGWRFDIVLGGAHATPMEA